MAIKYANSDPVKVTHIKGAMSEGQKYTNTLPWKVELTNDDLAYQADIQNLQRQINALEADLTWRDPVETYGELPATGNEDGDVRLVTSTGILYVWAENEWVALNENQTSLKELTAADYNYPADNPTSVALWLLEPGTYTRSTADGVVVRYGTGNSQLLIDNEDTVLVTSPTASGSKNYLILASNGVMLKIAHSTSSGGDSESQMILTGANVAQSTGTSRTDVMSQKATTDMVFLPDVSNNRQSIRIGNNAAASTSGNSIALLGQAGYLSVAIGGTASTSIMGAVALGLGSSATADGAVALGRNSTATTRGTVGVGTTNTTYGYNGSNYRLITGVYDGQSAHDVATYGQLSTAILNGGTTAPTSTTVGAIGTLYSYVDTTGVTPVPHLMVCTMADTATPSYTWVEVGGSSGSTVEPLTDNELNNLWNGESS